MKGLKRKKKRCSQTRPICRLDSCRIMYYYVMQRSTMQSLLIHYNHNQTKHFGSCSKKKQPFFQGEESWGFLDLPKKTFETQHVEPVLGSEVWLAVQPPLGIPGDPMRLLLLGSFVLVERSKTLRIWKNGPPGFVVFFRVCQGCLGVCQILPKRWGDVQIHFSSDQGPPVLFVFRYFSGMKFPT